MEKQVQMETMTQLDKLHASLSANNFFEDNQVSVKIEPDFMHLTFHQYGDLPVILVLGGHQILVEALLVERCEFSNPEQIDYQLLCTHKYLPLSTIAIEQINGIDWYVLFGALSLHSKIEVLIEELMALVNNTFDVIDALEPLYKFNQ